MKSLQSFSAFATNRADQRTRGVIRAGNKLHQRAEAPSSGPPENMQSREGRFESLSETRVTIGTTRTTNGLSDLRSQELVLRNVQWLPLSQRGPRNVRPGTAYCRRAGC